MTWLNNGQSIKVPIGNYRIEFKELEGFRTPTNIIVSVNKNLITNINVEYIPINNQTNLNIMNLLNSFNNIYYVSSHGDDITGNGSENNPYATITKAFSLCALNNDAIFILDNVTMPLLTFNKNISLIGDYFNRGSMITTTTYRCFRISTNYTLKIYNLYLYQPIGVYEMFDGYYGTYTNKGYVEIYNSVIYIPNSSRSENIHLQGYICRNCIRWLPTLTTITKSYAANAKYFNTATIKKSLILGNNSTESNCLNNVIVDSMFNITSPNESLWKNQGLNLSNQPTNIGVYGGEYTWI